MVRICYAVLLIEADGADHEESVVDDEEKETNFEIIPTPEVNSANLFNMDIQDEQQLAQNEELIDNWMEVLDFLFSLI